MEKLSYSAPQVHLCFKCHITLKICHTAVIFKYLDILKQSKIKLYY